MIHAAAGAHSRLLEGAKTGRGLPRVADPGVAGRRPNEPSGHGRDARQMTQEVQRCALGGKHRRERPLDGGDVSARLQLLAVVQRPAQDDRRIDLRKGLAGAQPPGQHAFLARDDLAAHKDVDGDEGTGDVAHRKQILGQGAGDDLADSR